MPSRPSRFTAMSGVVTAAEVYANSSVATMALFGVTGVFGDKKIMDGCPIESASVRRRLLSDRPWGEESGVLSSIRSQSEEGSGDPVCAVQADAPTEIRREASATVSPFDIRRANFIGKKNAAPKRPFGMNFGY